MAETATQSRRLPRKRVRIVKVTVTHADGATEEVEGKKCTECGVEKALTEYHEQTMGLGGRRSKCRECLVNHLRNYRGENTLKVRESQRSRYEKNSERERERSRNYRRENSEKRRESCLKYYESNPNVYSAARQRYRAMKRALPSVWNDEDAAQMTECSLTKSTEDVHADHVIPLASGHGGTYAGNMAPLIKVLNISKKDAHASVWFEANRQRFNLDPERFDAMFDEKAQQNGLTPQEYRDYYDWCLANPRTVDETRRDNARYGYRVSSVELWRESTGIQFPLRLDFRDQKPQARRTQAKRSERQAEQST
ncbi:hypothetical protein [Paenibacillus sp. P22]|uniref:hypothetical protein n=1 Tax=Paenibacillus sp. P22 TaxID=483908 RepID=UPI000420C927|nr:hypothetical protein [Paenibacillus sp. P22]CDN42008.1 hypothetical protein BN871_AT_00100 [Paenibacillus sp. P22]